MLRAAGAPSLLSSLYLHRIYAGSPLKRPKALPFSPALPRLWPPRLHPRPAMGDFCNLEKKATHCSLTGWSRANLAGARKLQSGGLWRWAHLPAENQKPSHGCASVCPETNNMHFLKYASIWYNAKWWVKKKFRLQLGWKPLHPLVGKIKCKNRQMDTYVNVAVF